MSRVISVLLISSARNKKLVAPFILIIKMTFILIIVILVGGYSILCYLLIQVILGTNFKQYFSALKTKSTLILKSCPHNITLVTCAICIAGSRAAADKRTALLYPLRMTPPLDPITSRIAYCTHKWNVISDNTINQVSCDFGHPVHTVGSGLASFCENCHAVCCLFC